MSTSMTLKRRPAASRDVPAKRERVGAVSEAAPDAIDLRDTASLALALTTRGLGLPALAEARTAVRERIGAVVSQWVAETGVLHGLSATQAADAGCCVMELGSCALGVPAPGADIDLVAVVPYFVERGHFFADGESGGLCSRLRSGGRALGIDVSSLHAVPGAFVPVLKFVMRGVPVDLLLARQRRPQIPARLEPSGIALLRPCMEEADVHSLNGARVAAAILRLVPNRGRFQHTLRAVKLWAQRRGLNNHSLGYPGGVAWALLTARVCQLHPNAAASTLLSKFFSTWMLWKFGGTQSLGGGGAVAAGGGSSASAGGAVSAGVPVFLDDDGSSLTSAASAAPNDGGVGGGADEAGGGGAGELPPHLSLGEWTPRDPQNARYLMPIITPCRPKLCSSHTVCASTLAVLKSEFARAAALDRKAMSTPLSRSATPPVLAGGAGGAVDTSAAAASAALAAAEARYGALFEPISFFTEYRAYVAVHVSADDEGQMLHWRSYVKTRLRRLVLFLESLPAVEWVHPLPWAMRGLPARPEGATDDESRAAHADAVAAGPRGGCTFYLGLRYGANAGERAGQGAAGSGRRVDLRPCAAGFVNLVYGWEEKRSLCPSGRVLVRHVFAHELCASVAGVGGSELPFDDEHEAAAMGGGDVLPPMLSGEDGRGDGDGYGDGYGGYGEGGLSDASADSGRTQDDEPPPVAEAVGGEAAQASAAAGGAGGGAGGGGAGKKKTRRKRAKKKPAASSATEALGAGGGGGEGGGGAGAPGSPGPAGSGGSPYTPSQSPVLDPNWRGGPPP